MTARLEYVHPCNVDTEPMGRHTPCGMSSVECIADGVYLCELHRGLAAEAGGVPIIGGGVVRRAKASREHTSGTADAYYDLAAQWRKAGGG